MSRRMLLPGLNRGRSSLKGQSKLRRGVRLLNLEALEIRSLLTVMLNPDVYVALESSQLNVAAPGVLGNDMTTTGTGLKVSSFTQPADGTLTLNPDGSFQYLPKAGYTGADQFTYTAADAAGGDGHRHRPVRGERHHGRGQRLRRPPAGQRQLDAGDLLNTVLGGLVGTNLNLTAADYDGLAAGTINGGRLADALGAELGVTPSQALTTNATLAQIYTAAATAAQADGDTADATALNNLATSVGGITAPVQLGNLIQANPNDGSLAGASLNALDLVNGTAQLFNFAQRRHHADADHRLRASLGLPGVVTSAAISAQVVEPPILTTGPAGTQFHSSAVRLRTDLNLADNLNTARRWPPRCERRSGRSSRPRPPPRSASSRSTPRSPRGKGRSPASTPWPTPSPSRPPPGWPTSTSATSTTAVFFNRNHVIDPATDVTYGNVGTLNIAATPAPRGPRPQPDDRDPGPERGAGAMPRRRRPRSSTPRSRSRRPSTPARPS